MIRKVLTALLLIVSAGAEEKVQDRTLGDGWNSLIGAGVGAGAGAVPGGVLGGGLGYLAGDALFQRPILGALGGAGAGALTGAGIGAATGAAAAPAVAGVVDDVFGLGSAEADGGKSAGKKKAKKGKKGKEGKEGKKGKGRKLDA